MLRLLTRNRFCHRPQFALRLPLSRQPLQLRFFAMPPKRKSDPKATDSPPQDKASAPKRKKKEWVPFDPTVPTNTKMPDDLKYPKTPKGAIKLASFNVSGLNASLKKGFKQYIEAEDADIVCLQETKVNVPLSGAVDDKVYKYRYWAHHDKKGYAGVAVFSKFKPTSVTYGLPNYDDGSRGRVITLTFPSFVFISCYVPNAGNELVRLPERRVFNDHMEKYIRNFQKEKKPVVWAG